MMILLLLSGFFLFLYGCLIFFYKRAWHSVPVFVPSGSKINTFISVVIAARNEEKHLPFLLSAMQKQTYPPGFFEVIIVDDFSTDATATLIQNASSPNIRRIQPNVSTEKSSKKKAIETGINAAKGELIVITDADCYPPPRWLEVFNEFNASTGATFIAAPVVIQPHKNLLQIFQTLDFLTLQGITAAGVVTGFHTMCNGANLAYRKQSFYDVNGFEGIDKVASGDDMLLMYKIWKNNPAKVFYLKSREVIVSTEPMLTLRDFIMQRKRWASKTLVYEDYRIIAVLAFVFVLNCLFVIWVFASLFHASLWQYVVLFWIIKTLIELPFVYQVAKFFQQQELIKYFLLLQPLHIFYTVIVGIISQFGRYEWKGRTTK